MEEKAMHLPDLSDDEVDNQLIYTRIGNSNRSSSSTEPDPDGFHNNLNDTSSLIGVKTTFKGERVEYVNHQAKPDADCEYDDEDANVEIRSAEEKNLIQNDQYHRRTKSNHFIYCLTFISAIGGFLFGYDTGVVSGAMLLLRENFVLSNAWQESIVSVTMGAAALFALIGGPINDMFGRKPTIILASFVFTVGAIELAISVHRLMLLAGRFILGIGIGFASATTPMYLAESAPPELRGRLVTLYQLQIAFGIVVASIIDGAFSFDAVNGWRYMFGLASVPAMIQLIGFCFMPESPRWLVTKGRENEARAVLQRIRSESNVDDELMLIKASLSDKPVRASKTVLLRILTTSHVRRALIVGCGLQFFQQIVGINTVIYYSASVIKMSGVKDNTVAIWLAALVAATSFVFTIVAVFLVDRINRRTLTLGSLIGATLSLVVLALGFQIAASRSPLIGYNETEVFNETDICSMYRSCNDCIMDTSCGFCYEDLPDTYGSNGSCLSVPFNKLGEHEISRASHGRCNSTHLSSSLTWAYGYCPSSVAWLTTFGLILYLMFFAIGMGPMPWTINSEIYPLWARSTGNSITTCVNWIFNLFISMTFLTLAEVLTRYGVFYLYSGFGVIGIVFISLCLPETRNKPLEEVEELFKQPAVVCCKRNDGYRYLRS